MSSYLLAGVLVMFLTEASVLYDTPDRVLCTLERCVISIACRAFVDVIVLRVVQPLEIQFPQYFLWKENERDW